MIEKYPEYKEWVIHNKTIPIQILERLTLDKDPKVRTAVARKRKINDKIFSTLSQDKDENVRYALMCNTNLTVDKLRQIKIADSDWLVKQMSDRIKELER